MTVELTSDQVWEVIEKELFGVIGIPLMKMRDPEQARGRAPVGVQ